jgi:hypothetical protein
MLRGCVLSLSFLAALAYGYYYWFDQVFEPPASIIAAIVVGFLVLCCLGALNNARTAWKDGSRVAAARFGAQLVDGRVATVAGTIHPVGEPLIAPFSRTPCVICEYDIASHDRASASDNGNSGSDYAGFLMAPSVIRTPLGEVRLLGFPITEGFYQVRCYSHNAALHAREFLQSNEFEDRSGLKIVSVLTAFGEIWSDDDGLVQKNMRLSKASLDKIIPTDLDEDLKRLDAWRKEHPEAEEDDKDEENDDDQEVEQEDVGPTFITAIPSLFEKCVAVGEQVVAIGVYDEMQRGLRPPGAGGPPNRLLRGTADQIESRSRSSMIRLVLGGLIGLLVIHGAILGVMQIYLHSPDVLRDRQQKATQAVLREDLDALAPLVRRGLDINFRDSEGRTLLMLVREPTVSVWLIEHDADVNLVDNVGESALSMAARFGRTEIVRQLIAAQAELNPRSKSTGNTPLAEAVLHGHDEIAAVLREAGARE